MTVAQLSVLISHHPADRQLAQRLFEGLRDSLPGSAVLKINVPEPATKARMQRVDDPRDLSPDALEHADLILLLVTERYVSDPLTGGELRRAFELHTTGQAKAILVRGGPAELPEEIAAALPVTPSRREFLTERFGVGEVAAYVGGIVSTLTGGPAPLDLSPSVRRATGGMADDPVSAYAIVSEILRLHPEYGDGQGERLNVAELPGAERRTATEWLQDVRELFSAEEVETLHGRMVIRGLALLEPDLTKELLDNGFLSSLEGELMPLLPRLSERGRRLWDPGDVPTLADRPARVDKLRRREFARGLADMLAEERKHSEDATGGRGESFLVQLHGEWGSGKSTLLGFMKEELEGMDWVVVDFNAWQQERLEAPWWSLMTAVHRTSRRALARAGQWWRVARLTGLELWWRFKMGWPAYVLLPVVLGLLWYAISNDWFDSATAKDGWLAQAGDLAKAVGAILSVVVVVYGAVRGLARSFAAGSAKGADTFLKTSQDPMRTLRQRYERIVETAGRPIAVFVDDLDRCQPEYVVEVLQGIQTLLIDAPVTYVVAADRRWLFDSYKKIYGGFESVATDPGRPLGHLFLEKTFQMAASLPAIPVDVRDAYWRGLVVPEDGDDEERAADLADEAAERVADVGLEGTLEAVEESRQLSSAEEAATRAAASRRLGDEDIRREVEHRLIPFAPLLEPNPRAMKRLLNAYRIELRRAIAEGRQVGTGAVTAEQLALWTILTMRWPLLAEELARRPHALADDGNPPSSNGLAELWGSDEVQAVVEGDGVRARLTEPAVCALVGARRRRRQGPPPPPAAGAGNGGQPPVA